MICFYCNNWPTTLHRSSGKCLPFRWIRVPIGSPIVNLARADARPKADKTLIDRLQPPDGKSEIVQRDTEVKGFGVRVRPKGSKTYVFQYKLNGRPRKVTIGDTSTFTLAEARDRARRMKVEVRDGGDPASERKKAKAATTVKELFERRLEQADWSDSYREANRSQFERFILKRWGAWKVSDVTSAHVEDLKYDMRKTPAQANRVLSVVKSTFNTAVRAGQIERNPTNGVKPYQERRRTKHLTEQQANEFLRHVTAAESVPAMGILLLLLTGCRTKELIRTEWTHLDLAKGTWLKPAPNTKHGEESVVPLSDDAVAVFRKLRELQDTPSRWVFPSLKKPKTPDEPEKHRHDFRKAWLKIKDAAGLEGFAPHDLRHSFAAFSIREGMGLPLLGQIMGHQSPATTQRYLHLIQDAAREGVNKVATGLKVSAHLHPAAEPTDTPPPRPHTETWPQPRNR